VNVKVLNKGSFGGELVLLYSPPSHLVKEFSENGVKLRESSENMFFLILDIRKCKSNKFKQFLIDLVEEDANYEIKIEI
jgi:hypothetical protein